MRTRNLQRSLPAFVIADTDCFIDTGPEDFPVTDLSGTSGIQNRLFRLFDERIRQYHLDLCLRNQIDAVLAAAIDLGVSFLPSVPAHLDYCHALDADFLQCSLHCVQLGILNDCFDLRHDICKSCFGISTRSSFRILGTAKILKLASPNSNPLPRAGRDRDPALLPPRRRVSQWSNPPVSRSPVCRRWQLPRQWLRPPVD